jgi:ribosome-associated translation inhibitor RaiA
MIVNCTASEAYEISPRFRRIVEERVARLERDAAQDEANVMQLDDADHIRRQMRLVAAQRVEALRMRIFLDRATARKQPAPTVAR